MNTYLIYLRFELVRGRLDPTSTTANAAVVREWLQAAASRICASSSRPGRASAHEAAERRARRRRTSSISPHEAKGVARHRRQAVFVADALPGERVVMRRAQRRRNFDEAVLERVLRASPDRVPAECQHFGLCGGCALQHLAPARAARVQAGAVAREPRAPGRRRARRVLDPLTGPVWGYRRRARLGVKLRAAQGARAGRLPRARRRPTSRTCTSAACSRRRSARLLTRSPCWSPGFSIATRLPQIEVAVADDACALVLRVLDPPSAGDLEAFARFEIDHSRAHLPAAGRPGHRAPAGRPARRRCTTRCRHSACGSSSSPRISSR